jgi:predicted dehydrogenase
VISTAAVRGTGSIGSRHLRVLRAVGVDDLVAVPVRPGRSTSPELADARISDVLPEGVDLVVIATDTSRHVADTIEALDRAAGIVLVEKPLAHTVAETEALLTHPRADRVRVCAPLRFHEGLRAARARAARLCDEARGAVAARIVSQSWLPAWRPDRDFRASYSARPGEGGVLLDLVHEIDYALWTFGAPAGALQATLSPLPSPVLGLEVDEAADLTWSNATGTLVSLRLDYVTRPTRRSLDVTSPYGSVRWDAIASTVEVTGADGTVERTAYPDDLDRDEVLARQVRALASVLDGGPEDDLLDLETARLAVEITERARAVGRHTTEDHPAPPANQEANT